MNLNRAIQNKAIVINDHTLGVVMGDMVQILRASVLKGSPYPDKGAINMPDESEYRLATESDFSDFKISFHQDYI